MGAITALTGVSLSLNAARWWDWWATTGRASRRWSRSSPAISIRAKAASASAARKRSCTAPRTARSKGIEIVYQDLALARQFDRGGEHLPRPRAAERAGAARLQGDVSAGRGAVRGAEIRDPAARRGAADVGRAAPGLVAIARTRLSNPKIVLMDEPTAAISVRQVAEVLNLIRRLKDQGIAVVLISHRIPDILRSATGWWCCGAAARWPTSVWPTVRPKR